MHKTALTALLIGAGASIEAAHPAHHHHHYTSSSAASESSSVAGAAATSSADICEVVYSTVTPTSVAVTVGAVGSSGVAPTYAMPNGTGYAAYPSGIFPSGSGIAVGPTGSSTGVYSWASRSVESSSSVTYSPESSSATPSSYSVDATTPVDSSSVITSITTSTPNSTIAATSTTASASVSSAAAAAAAATTAPTSGISSVAASAGCTFTDLDSAVSGKASCSSIVLSGIAVAAGKTLDMTDLSDGLFCPATRMIYQLTLSLGTTVTFEGTTTFGYSEWDGPLISFSGTDITIQGASGHLIDMEGDQWWDAQGSNGGVTKPKGFYAHDLTDSVIQDLSIKNTPIRCFSINGASNLQVIDVTIDNTAGDVTDGGHNTDAFDIGSSTGVYISGANVKNQDDCVAINSGTDISFTGGTCSGGHGLSIGSVGGRDDNDVANVYFGDSTVSDSANGVRIKTVSGATGSVKNITYSGITLTGITDYGIVIEQDYENGSPMGTPTDGVPITDVTLSGITGDVASDASPYYILCASCSDWTVTGVSVTAGKASSDCMGEPSGVSLC
ncbi:Polygalacturonase 1 [Teratosphaeriaceae sp. CCFEE 6253]|nr:Polygalacturonase 1 [Teratosphaeriaceae sp. CCFEE 6253]